MVDKVNFAFEPSEEEKKFVKELCDEDQGHLFAHWTKNAEEAPKQRKLIAQLIELGKTYPGGVIGYIKQARILLAKSRDGISPFTNLSAEVPDEAKCAARPSFITNRAQWDELEAIGLKAVKDTAFMLVAGGIGERLGYNGIKVALESNLATRMCFLERYCRAIKELGGDEFAIMTSDDTHSRTLALLQEHSYFGLDDKHVHLLKQGMVPCVTDAAAHIALSPNDKFAVEAKPHGHGDVHSLLHMSGLLDAWLAKGKRYVVFFQDTNPLFFRTLPVALGVSEQHHWVMNSVAIPRMPREAIGGLCCLVDSTTRAIVHPLTNVEYNEIPTMMPGGVEPAPDEHHTPSPFVGNINELLLSLEPYAKTLARTGGLTPEFVNPKYADPETRTTFKAAARLECLMQDYARSLKPDDAVGFTQLDAWLAFSPMKNTLEQAALKWRGGNPPASVASGELDQYRANSRIVLSACDGRAKIVHSLDEIDSKEPYVPKMVPLVGMEFEEWPMFIYNEAWAPSLNALGKNIPGRLVMTARSFLVIDCDNSSTVTIKNLVLDGALEIRARNGANIVIDYAKPVVNDGVRITPIGSTTAERTKDELIRGFYHNRVACVVVSHDQAGTFVHDKE